MHAWHTHLHFPHSSVWNLSPSLSPASSFASLPYSTTLHSPILIHSVDLAPLVKNPVFFGLTGACAGAASDVLCDHLQCSTLTLAIHLGLIDVSAQKQHKHTEQWEEAISSSLSNESLLTFSSLFLWMEVCKLSDEVWIEKYAKNISSKKTWFGRQGMAMRCELKKQIPTPEVCSSWKEPKAFLISRAESITCFEFAW